MNSFWCAQLVAKRWIVTDKRQRESARRKKTPPTNVENCCIAPFVFHARRCRRPSRPDIDACLLCLVSCLGFTLRYTFFSARCFPSSSGSNDGPNQKKKKTKEREARWWILNHMRADAIEMCICMWQFFGYHVQTNQNDRPTKKKTIIVEPNTSNKNDWRYEARTSEWQTSTFMSWKELI